MGLFRRDTSDPTPQGRPAFGQNGVPAASELEFESAIQELEQVVVEGMREAPLPRETLELLQVGLPYLAQRDCSDQAVVAGQTGARLGYLARAAESAMFECDVSDDEDLLATLGERFDAAETNGTSPYDAMAELSAELAAGEPLDPASHEGGPSWTLPGLPAPFRGRLRENLVARIRCPPDVPAEDMRRTWKYGYFLRALDELCDDE